MSDNLRHWDALRKTDPKHTKPFQRAGGFRGTAIKPIYMTQMMTEYFGGEMRRKLVFQNRDHAAKFLVFWRTERHRSIPVAHPASRSA